MNLILKIEKIKNLLNRHQVINPNHKESCQKLIEKLNSFEKHLVDDTGKREFLYWCKWFAPRIIYEGIGDKDILSVLDEINQKHTI